jgi:hypothetical protein
VIALIVEKGGRVDKSIREVRIGVSKEVRKYIQKNV